MRFGVDLRCDDGINLLVQVNGERNSLVSRHEEEKRQIFSELHEAKLEAVRAAAVGRTKAVEESNVAVVSCQHVCLHAPVCFLNLFDVYKLMVFLMRLISSENLRKR